MIGLILIALLLWAVPSWAALGIGQSELCRALTTTCTTTGVTTTNGSSFVVCVSGNGVPNTPSDSKSNTYTAIATELFLGANNRNRCYHALNATGGSSHTFTGSIASGSVVSVIAVEITTATTTAAESSARQTDNATAFLSPGTTTTHADSLLIGFQTLEGGSATYTPTHGNSFTGLDSETDGDLYYPVYSSYRAVSSGTYNTSITVTGSPTNTGNWVMAYYEVPPVISGCRLLQNGTDKRLTQNGTDGRILQGGGDCELGGGGPAVVPVRMMIGVGL